MRKKLKTNDIFGNWEVVEPYTSTENRLALCICLLCKTQHLVNRSHLSQGYSKQCRDCYRIQQKEKPAGLKHGMHGTKIYRAWKALITRTTNPQGRDKIHYKNIKVSKDWKRFENFYKDMGEPPFDGFRYSIGRIDNNGNYCKENCRWETDIQQANNTSRTRWITYKGETMSMMNWSRKLNKPYTLIRSRLRYGWSVEDALGK